jgi:hypothetical protein
MPRLEAAGYPIVMHTHDECARFLMATLARRVLITVSTRRAGSDCRLRPRISDRLIEIPEPTQAATVVDNNMVDNTVAKLEQDGGNGDGENQKMK